MEPIKLSMKAIVLLLVVVGMTGCASMTTLDMEDALTEETDPGIIGVGDVIRDIVETETQLAATQLVQNNPPEIIVVELPVFLPPLEFEQERASTEREWDRPLTEGDALRPIQTWAYDENTVYWVFTQPLRITDVELLPGEQVIGEPVIGDSSRWILGTGMSERRGLPVQHIYIKPTEIGLETSLIVNTNMRKYFFMLRSYSDKYHMSVSFVDPREEMPRAMAISGPNGGGAGILGEIENLVQDISINASNLRFDYNLSFRRTKRPTWVPTAVFDDGNKTFIVLPPSVLRMQMPVLYINNFEVTNLRYRDNTIIIDELIEEASLRLGDEVVLIEKKVTEDE